MNDYKEVYFDKYCETCEFKDVLETEDPCDGCLECGMNYQSSKPVKYKEKENVSK